MQPEKTNKTLKTLPIQNKKNLEQSRLNFRLASEVKDRVARAAALTGQDLTEFAVATLSEKADEVLEKHDSLLLNSTDYHFFLNALSETIVPDPSERSQRATRLYRRGTRKGLRYTVAD